MLIHLKEMHIKDDFNHFINYLSYEILIILMILYFRRMMIECFTLTTKSTN